ncbi:hypothetical protein OG909_24825 [Streptomyces sp. NBC_01754]|uniref:hypothetical protein n=1 Tax=Streptomyces sp. NBC_01754 TaxID=2975930 RepID=UPI002DDB817F|nr:hypothetical protein [Streptomyces sp. NBC_01754]WSC95240.1 hypothetical protein OG909_24825 [Streptomyces sp. NBC_01754]
MSDLRSLLDAVLDAIDVPYPATTADDKAYRTVLDRRLSLAVVVARAALAESPADYDWDAAYLRRKLAEHPPTGYQHYADTEAGR